MKAYTIVFDDSTGGKLRFAFVEASSEKQAVERLHEQAFVRFVISVRESEHEFVPIVEQTN